MEKPKTNKPKPDFAVRMVGQGIKPWAVPMRALTRTLNAVQRLMEHTEEKEEPDTQEVKPEDVLQQSASLHLLEIVSGSAVYRVAANEPAQAVKTLSEMGLSLSNPEGVEWGAELLGPIEDLSSVARSLGCSIEFWSPGKDGGVLATITPDSYDALSKLAFVRGEGSVYGYLERVGGVTEWHCALRVPSQPVKQIVCSVATEELVRGLGKHVYENVLVSGTVTWFRRTWQIKRINVRAFEPSKTGSIMKALERIHEAGGKAWDDIKDPEGFLAETRGE
jgi:hypothetical protein